MKLNKKIKYSLSILGLTGLSIVPLSLSLIGCSKSNDLIKDKKESREINQEFDQDFFENTLNLEKAPIGADKSQYKFLSKLLIKKNDLSQTKINKKLNNIRNGFYSSNEAEVYAKILLDKFDEKILIETLLLNFNKGAFIETNKFLIDGQPSEISGKKSIYTIKKLEYDKKTRGISFVLVHNYDSVHSLKINEYDEEIKQLFKTTLTIEFKNIILKPSYFQLNIGGEVIYIPIFTIDINNKNLSIKYIDSETKININEYLKQELKFANYLNSNEKIDKTGYDKMMEFIEKFKKYWCSFGESTNNIKNLDFSSISFIDNSQDMFLSPFLSEKIVSINEKYNNKNLYRLFPYSFGIGILDDIVKQVELNNTYSLKFNSLVRTKFGIPVFNFINNIENKSDDFFFVTTDENAITIPNPYFDFDSNETFDISE